MPPLLPYDALFSIAFAGVPALTKFIGIICSSYRAFRTSQLLSLLHALYIIQLSHTNNETRRFKLIQFSNKFMLYASQLPLLAISEHCVGVLAFMAKWGSGHRAWEVREAAIMILEDVGMLGERQLAALRLDSLTIASELLRHPSTEAWRNYQQMEDCHKRRQCDAALLAHDHKWLYLEPSSVTVRRPRMFSLGAAPSTHVAECSSSSTGLKRYPYRTAGSQADSCASHDA